MRSPISYFAVTCLGSIAMVAYFGHMFVTSGFDWMPFLLMLLFVSGAVLLALELKRFRLGLDGLAIQHLLTRRTRVIPYASMDKVVSTSERGGRQRREHFLVNIQHDKRVESVRFFEKDQRDGFRARLDACRQGEILANADPVELPQAKLAQPDWIYPWRRSA
ncbi:hypothetical protein [Haliangium ochraceum]|uniref:Uncharacterized protein n=1 Tax=Haliangium ochraceum (strain DSM 14365 / JCM 11303 / SMP-2) TaxID=502025 RepID=D0LR54_HALO1|nr:hypothetical protein [Haliangium ochraceum]ACY15562.1 hypothetical protein Hoch_3056 [Haliangium ochraceum DSM 14365]